MDTCPNTGAMMDTSDRYPLTMARDILTRQYGRKTTAQLLVRAKFDGPQVLGGTKITAYAGPSYTIQDA